MRLIQIAGLALLLVACDGSENRPRAPSPATPSYSSPPAPSTIPDGQKASGRRWDLQASGEGVALTLLRGSGSIIRLFCPTGDNRLLVNVNSFQPVGSEERLSFGSGGEAVALVADARGDERRGGVSGAGAAPANLKEILAGPVSASYGSQTTGPHAAAPANLSRLFVAACLGDAKT